MPHLAVLPGPPLPALRDRRGGWRPVALLLVGRADGDQAPVGARHRPLHQDEVVVRVDAHHAQVAHRDALVAVAPRHALTLLGPAAAPVARVRADATRG